MAIVAAHLILVSRAYYSNFSYSSFIFIHLVILEIVVRVILAFLRQVIVALVSLVIRQNLCQSLFN